MIDATRFLVSRGNDEPAWFAARSLGVTATAVAEVAAKRDRQAAIEAWLSPTPVEQNVYMQFGVEAEPQMMRYAHSEHGILPIDWVIASDRDGRHLASPDGLSLDHRLIAECKAPGDPWDSALVKITGIPIRYRRQVQWQLHVTGAERCLFLWNRRVEDGAWFRLAWFEPRSVWIGRDEEMIADLIEVATEMLEARDGAIQRAA
ncbi:putative phage-type endonuclease [Microbacterium resistens]|uniref:Phage-type endonuclease n=1 Tax=Microbacterium resistens TaxID=156977 RepID=A0ABU1SDG3_9MICO|nr:YqaJ viral recombinase family protein [Microbacterium resistens]MDR6867650.1 putative phage-type endonuclease [Microbacterium resistens]